MNYTFEKANPSHLDALAQFYSDLHDHLGRTVNHPGWVKDVYPTRETAEEGIRDDGLYLLKKDGEIAASVILRHTPEPAYHGAAWLTPDDYARITVIYTFAVHPAHLHQGVGRRLMQHVVETARAAGDHALRLDVYELNLPAIRLYESCGFRHTGTVDLGLAMHGLHWFRLYELPL